MKVLFVWPNKDDPFFRPISISLLSALLKRAGHETACFDTSFVDFGSASTSGSQTEAGIFKPVDWSSYDLQKKKVDVNKVFTEKLQSFQPDAVAFTVLSDVVEIAKMLSEAVKRWNNKTPVIWGGKGAAVEVERILSFNSVDFVCIGEGIIAFPQFINALEKNESPHKIKNICYRSNGSIVKNDLCPLFDDFDGLPYLDWSIFDKRLFFKPYEGRVYRGGDHMIAWGCPNRCTYCINNFYHQMYGGFRLQRYSPKRIIAEIKELTKTYNIEFYKFHDEDFLLKPKEYFEELADLYANEVNVPFVCMANPKSVTVERVELLKKMGCVSVSLGIETGDMRLRKNMLKRMDSREDIIRAFKLLKGAAIRANAFNMLAIPFETRQTYMRTILLNREADVQNPQVGFFFPFKETQLREIAIKNGFYDPGDEKIFNPDRPALHFKNLSEEELIMMGKMFVLYAKLPKRFWPFIRRSEKTDAVGRALEKKLHEIHSKCVLQHDGWFNDNGQTATYISELRRISKG